MITATGIHLSATMESGDSFLWTIADGIVYGVCDTLQVMFDGTKIQVGEATQHGDHADELETVYEVTK